MRRPVGGRAVRCAGGHAGGPGEDGAGQRGGQPDVAGLAVGLALPAGQQVGLGGQWHTGEQSAQPGRAAVRGGVLLQGVPDGLPERALQLGVAVGERGEQFGDVVDQQAVHHPVPAAFRVVGHRAGHLGWECGEDVGVLLGDELGALQIAEEHLDGVAGGVHADQHVLQVRFEHHTMVEVGGQDRREEQPQVVAPPVERRRAVRTHAQQAGDVRGTGRVLVGDGGREQRGDAGPQHAAEALPDDQAEALVQCPVGPAVGAGQREGAEGRFAQHDRGREAPGEVGQGQGEQPGERDGAGELVRGLLAQAVGDANVQAELEEGVGAVQGAHRGGGGETLAARAQVEDVAPGQGGAQQRVFADELILPRVRGQQPVAVRHLAEAVQQCGRALVQRLLGQQVRADGEVAQREGGAGLGGVAAPVAAGGGSGLGGRVEAVAEQQCLLGLQVAVGAWGGRSSRPWRTPWWLDATWSRNSSFTVPVRSSSSCWTYSANACQPNSTQSPSCSTSTGPVKRCAPSSEVRRRATRSRAPRRGSRSSRRPLSAAVWCSGAETSRSRQFSRVRTIASSAVGNSSPPPGRPMGSTGRPAGRPAVTGCREAL